MTLACATREEAKTARRLAVRVGARVQVVVVGLGARRELPEGKIVSFGLAGSLHDGLGCGEVLDATRVVDANGDILWEGKPLGASGARPGTILAVESIIDDPAERRRLHDRTGADAADMESGVLARSGRLVGCLRAISDTPTRTLGPLAKALDEDGRLTVAGLIGMFSHPRRTGRALADVRRALRRLEGVSA